MKKIVTLLGLISYGAIFAQTGNVGINTATPNANAVLDVVSTNRGFLPPRIALTSTASSSPLSAHVAGMVVYNTATAGTSPNNVVPGLYYNDGTQWVLSKGTSGGPAVNIYNSDGTLTSARTMTMAGNQLTMANGGTNTTFVHNSGESIIRNTGTNRGTFSAKAGSSSLDMFIDNGSVAQISSSGTATGLNIGPSTATPLKLQTSGVDRVTVTSSGLVGVNTVFPTEQLDIATGNVRIRNINTITGTSADRVVIADATGVLKSIPASGLAINNIYNSDGTLTGNRLVTQNASNLTFGSTTGNLIFSPSSTGRFGVGTASPTGIAHIVNPVPGNTTDALQVGINNCGLACAQSTARNIVMYNLNSSNSQFANLAFVPSGTPTAQEGALIAGIDRDATNNSAGILIQTRDVPVASGGTGTTNMIDRFVVKNTGNVGVNTSVPNGNAILDVVSSNKGFLPPRMALTSTASPSPLSSHVAGMMVYNTATINDVSPALYYNDGTQWVISKGGGTMSNIYNSDGTLTSARTMTMAGNKLTMEDGAGNIYFSPSAADSRIINTGTNRASYGFRAGSSALDIIVDNGNVAQISSAGTATGLSIGTGTATPLTLKTSGTGKVTVTSSGLVGIGTTSPTSTLSVNGSADKPGGGSWGTFSDRRVKKDIQEFKDGLNVINKLTPVTYRYNEKSGYEDLDKKYVGFIAQDVEKAAPYMVNIIDDSKKSGLKDKRELDESALTKILVNAVKEQQQEIAQLRKEVEELKKRKK